MQLNRKKLKKIFLVKYLFLTAVFLYSSCGSCSEIKVAVFPFEANAKEDLHYLQSALHALFPTRITETGRITVFEGDVLKRHLNKNTAPSNKATLIVKPPPFSSIPQFRYTIKGRIVHFLASGDVIGDNKKELLMAGDGAISIYTIDKMELKLLYTIKIDTVDKIIHLDVSDINGNGIDEIYVSCYGDNRPDSTVFEYSSGIFKPIVKSQRCFFRTYKTNNSTPILIGQKADYNTPFSGAIYRFIWKDKKLISREEFITPVRNGIYSFTECDIDRDGNTDYLSFYRIPLKATYYFGIFSYTGRLKWIAPDNIGGTPDFFLREISDGIEIKEYIPLRILRATFAEGGNPCVIVGKNYNKNNSILDNFVYYNQGEVLCLYWNGTDLIKNWSSKSLNGYVTDYLLEDFDHDNKKELYILSTSENGIFGKSTNCITVFQQN